MKPKIYYRWVDGYGDEFITGFKPEPTRGPMGGFYTPSYEKVVVIPVEDN